MDFINGIFHYVLIGIQVLLVFNLIIFVHELGHFLAARWRGLYVDKFQIWFGKPIWKKKIGDVQYGLGWMPLGGFVSLPQLSPMGGLEGERPEGAPPLQPTKPLDKIIVAFAGPLFSFFLAFALAVVVWGTGYPKRFDDTTTVGFVHPEMPGASSGLKAGDKILEIDGVPVKSWNAPLDSVVERIAFSQGESITFKVSRPGVEEPLEIKSGFRIESGSATRRRGVREVGIAPEQKDVFILEISNEDNVPAQLDGLKVGDQVLAVDGEKVYSGAFVISRLRESEGVRLPMTILRNGKELELSVLPTKPLPPNDQFAMIGAAVGPRMDTQAQSLVHPKPWDLVSDSLKMTWRTLAALVSPKSDVKPDNLGSAVMIFDVFARLFQLEDGWRLVLWFSVILNVNLALLNLLPFPVLDGGHIVFGILEWIRGKTLSLRVMEMIQSSAAFLLIGLMLYLVWMDSWAIGRGNGASSEERKIVFPQRDAIPSLAPSSSAPAEAAPAGGQ